MYGLICAHTLYEPVWTLPGPHLRGGARPGPLRSGENLRKQRTFSFFTYMFTSKSLLLVRYNGFSINSALFLHTVDLN